MKKILIVEDDPRVRNLYTRALELSGYEVETTENGQDALDKLSATKPKPDLILLDVMMPKLSGFDVLGIIKKDEELKKVPVIVTTNMESLKNASNDLEKLRALGAEDIVIKSNLDPNELVKKI
jgi:CheY-like chemotaxis protein